MNAVTGDLHLKAGATAAIDQAAPLANVGDDYDGQPRDLSPDLGADEFNPPVLDRRVYLPVVRR